MIESWWFGALSHYPEKQNVSGSKKKKMQKMVGSNSYIASDHIYTEQSPNIPVIQQTTVKAFISTII